MADRRRSRTRPLGPKADIPAPFPHRQSAVGVSGILWVMNAGIASFILQSIALGTVFASADAQAVEPARMHVNGVDLSYVEQGGGAPVILLHGGMGDYSSWQPQLEPFTRRFRVITYSRRYSFPNDNPSVSRAYSPWTDVEDLAALIR